MLVVAVVGRMEMRALCAWFLFRGLGAALGVGLSLQKLLLHLAPRRPLPLAQEVRRQSLGSLAAHLPLGLTHQQLAGAGAGALGVLALERALKPSVVRWESPGVLHRPLVAAPGAGVVLLPLVGRPVQALEVLVAGAGKEQEARVAQATSAL